MSALTCSTITLAQGAVAVDVDDLTLQGPGAQTLTIDGADADSVIAHYGAGTLAIDKLTIAHGRYDGGSPYPDGGCIYSSRQRHACRLDRDRLLGRFASRVHRRRRRRVCHAEPYHYGQHDLQQRRQLLRRGRRCARNRRYPNQRQHDFRQYRLWQRRRLVGSGCLDCAQQHDRVQHRWLRRRWNFVPGGYPLELQSTIVANNTATMPNYAADIGGNSNVTITGANNLVVTSDPIVPGDTLSSDPLLQPLADSGGPTLTHALGDGSPAIDMGNNIDDLEFDQRGAGFARVVGAATDIGALEVQAPPIIFQNGFELP